MNNILGSFAYAPTNLRIACLFFIHESWLFCVCHITPDYPSFITYPCTVSGLHLAHTSKYTLHNLAIPWENINNNTLNTSG